MQCIALNANPSESKKKADTRSMPKESFEKSATDTSTGKVLANSLIEKKLFLHCGIISILVLILDQVSKAIIKQYVGRTESITVIPGFFNIVNWRNTGAAFGMFAGNRWPLLAISIIFFIVVILNIRKISEGWTERYYAIALVLGGILGNSFDRIWREGKVIDFLDFYITNHHWPAFNVADSSICIGVGIFILSSIIRPEKTKLTK